MAMTRNAAPPSDSPAPRRRARLVSAGERAVLRNSHDQVVHAIGCAIVSGGLAPGGPLPQEEALLAQLKVSRTVLREALKTLAAKGMIVSRTRVGTHVLPREEWNLFDPDVLSWHVINGADGSLRAELTDFRLAMEPAAAALAALHATPAQIAEMRRLVAAMAQAQSSRLAFAQVDLALHKLIALASGNRLMAGTDAVIETALFASFTLSSPVDDLADHMASVRGHAAIVEAIAARDGVAAAHAVRGVIRHGQERSDAVEQRQREIRNHAG